MKTRLLYLLVFLFCPIIVFGQNLKITVKVISAMDQEPIIGASVLVKGTTNGTITDFDGNFQITASPNAILTISYIGYITQEVALKDETQIGRSHV